MSDEDADDLAEVISLDLYRLAKEAGVRPGFRLDSEGRWQVDPSREEARSRHPLEGQRSPVPV